MRLLLYLAVHRDRLVQVQEVSGAYRVSQHHLVKVVQLLVDQDLVASVRGRRGGLRLKARPDQINLGTLVRMTEPHLNLVECFDDLKNTCPIHPACGLKKVFHHAQRAFLDVLDRHTLADFLPDAQTLVPLWMSAKMPGRALPEGGSAPAGNGARLQAFGRPETIRNRSGR